MSFTQRAKKKFMVSLSRRKKLKSSQKEPVRPASDPVPSFSFPEDTQRNLSSSMSLPDQLDQSETSNVSKISSKSLSSIETSSPGVTLLSYVSDATPNPRGLNRLNSTPVFSSKSSKCNITNMTRLENQSERYACEESLSNTFMSSVSNSLDDKICQQMTSRKDNHLGTLSSLSRYGYSLDYGVYSHNPHIGGEEHGYSLWSSRSPEEVVSRNDCQTPSCLNANNHRGGFRNFSASEDTDESRSVEGDLGISEEDSEACDEVFKTDSADSLPKLSGSDNIESASFNDTNIALSTKDFQNMGEESENGQIGFKETTKNRCVCKAGTDESQVTIHCSVEASKVSRTDNSIVKKIKFFESYSEHRSKSRNSNQGTKSFTGIEDSKRSVSGGDVDTKTPPNNHVGVTTYYSDGGHGSNKVHQLKSITSYRVFPNSASARQRLNFSRFKRSDSIPEVVAICTCGDHCPGVCEPGGHDRVIHCQVCHHPQCTADNDDMPLMLCQECDLDIHRNHDDHLVLDTRPQRDVTEEQYNDGPSIETDGSDREDQPEVDVTREEVVDDLQLVRNKEDNSQVEKELSNTMTLKNGSYNLESPSKKRTGSDGQIIALTRRNNSELNQNEDQRSATLGRNTSLDGGQPCGMDSDRDSADPAPLGVAQSANRVKAVGTDGYFTLRFGDFAGKEEDFVVVAASKNRSLRDAIEPVLQGRGMDVSFVNVFIEKSGTPLPMSCDTVFLAGNILEVKEKENKEHTKRIKKTSSKKAERIERSSRRDSFGLVTPLPEAPSGKQRRGSMQLPFRDHFFTRSDSRNDGPKTSDDVSGSFRGFPRGASMFTEDAGNPASFTSSSDSRKLRSTKKNGSVNKMLVDTTSSR